MKKKCEEEKDEEFDKEIIEKTIEKNTTEKLSEEQLFAIQDEWSEKSVFCELYRLDDEEMKKRIKSIKDSEPEIEKVVHDYRRNQLLAKTKEFYFVYDLSYRKLTSHRLIDEDDFFQTNLFGNIEYWPHCDKVKFAEELQLISVHARACYNRFFQELETKKI